MIGLEAVGLACIRDDRLLFEDLSFNLSPSQVLLVEGENGSGKTSLLRILCGIRLPDAGEVLWNEQSVHQSQSAFAGDMAFLGHLDGNKLDLTVLENLRIAQALMKPGGDSIETALDKVKLGHAEDLQAFSLSAGQRRRLALARLLVSKTPLWILDEPFTALDKSGIAITESIIHTHVEQGGMAIMTSHHEVGLAESMITRINLSQ